MNSPLQFATRILRHKRLFWVSLITLGLLSTLPTLLTMTPQYTVKVRLLTDSYTKLSNLELNRGARLIGPVDLIVKQLKNSYLVRAPGEWADDPAHQRPRLIDIKSDASTRSIEIVGRANSQIEVEQFMAEIAEEFLQSQVARHSATIRELEAQLEEKQSFIIQFRKTSDRLGKLPTLPATEARRWRVESEMVTFTKIRDDIRNALTDARASAPSAKVYPTLRIALSPLGLVGKLLSGFIVAFILTIALVVIGDYVTLLANELRPQLGRSATTNSQ